MSADPIYTIFCDAPECLEWIMPNVARNARQARSGAAQMGWQVNVKTPGDSVRHDFCPKHRVEALTGR